MMRPGGRKRLNQQTLTYRPRKGIRRVVVTDKDPGWGDIKKKPKEKRVLEKEKGVILGTNGTGMGRKVAKKSPERLTQKTRWKKKGRGRKGQEKVMCQRAAVVVTGKRKRGGGKGL